MSSISTSTKVKTHTLSKQSEKLLTVMLAVMSPLMLIGLLEGVAYVWERTQANGLYAWELVASRRMVWERVHWNMIENLLVGPGMPIPALQQIQAK